MNLQEKLQKIWDNRLHIAEGAFNLYLSMNKEVKEESVRRLAICQANTCSHWDSTGTSEKLVNKGIPGCTLCGCRGDMKTSCMSCHCSLKDIGQEPLWDKVMDIEQDKEYRQKEWESQFKKD